MLTHVAQVRALRAWGVRRAPRHRAAAALPRCQQQVAAPHPDIAEVLLQPQQIAARVQEVGRCASGLGRACGPQPLVALVEQTSGGSIPAAPRPVGH